MGTNTKEVVYNIIKEHIDNYTYPPSIREIVTESKIKSTSTVHKYLKVLENEGYIVIDKNVSRGIRLVKH